MSMCVLEFLADTSIIGIAKHWMVKLVGIGSQLRFVA